MILVDRPLTSPEKRELGGRQVYELNDLPGRADKRFQQELLKWMDHMDDLTFNGDSAFEYFSLAGSSYWLHVRARIFYELFNDAQVLDRLPDLSLLDTTEAVYCKSHDRGFWQRWAPDARIIPDSGKPDNKSTVDLPELLGRFRFIIRHLDDLPRLLTGRKWEAVCLSPMTNTVRKNGLLQDRRLEKLFTLHRTDWMRLEYQHLPRYNPETTQPSFFELPRSQPTLPTDLLLAAYLLHHPALLVSMVRWGKQLHRFKKPLNHSWRFSFGDETWHRHLHRTIMNVTPSFLIFKLLGRAFGWLLDQVKPRVVLALAENNNFGRIFIDQAKKRGIPTFGIQHGIIAPHNIDYRFTRAEAKKALPDYFFAWGDRSRNYLTRKNHYDPEAVFIVGQPESDLLGDIQPDEALLKFSKERKKPLLFFASQQQQNPKSRYETARELARFCKRFGFCCGLKLHPAEDRDQLHLHQFREAGIAEDLTVTGEQLYPAIRACDYGATCYSTVAWEIMMMKKPLVIIDPLHLDLLKLEDTPSVYFAPGNKTAFAKWREDLKTHVKQNHTLAKQVLGPRDGNVSGRIDQIIHAKLTS